MSIKIEEWKVPMNGLLKDNFNLFFRVSQEIEKDKDILDFRLRIERLYNNEESKFLIEGITSKIKFNENELSGYKDLYFLGDNNNQILLFGKYDIQENDNIINFDISVEIDDESKYLTTTEMKNLSFKIIKDKKQIPKLYLDFINEPYTVNIIAHSTVDYGLIEFKVNDNNWNSNIQNSNKLTIAKINKKQYIQARIKIDNEYYYSKVLTIE